MNISDLKLNKQTLQTLEENSFHSLKDVQKKTIKRTLGGQNLVIVAPEKSGKTSAFIISLIQTLKHPVDEAPRALILCPTREDVLELEEQFETFNRYSKLRVLTMLPKLSLDVQRDDLFDGCDIVIGTPDRIERLLLQSAININKLTSFIIDDAEEHINQGFQTQIQRITESLPKCQQLVYSSVIHQKLEKLIDGFMVYPTLIEVEEDLEGNNAFASMRYYPIPNFASKQSFLRQQLVHREHSDDILVIINSRLTAGKLYQALANQLEEQVAIQEPMMYDQISIDTASEFLETTIPIYLVSDLTKVKAEEVEQFKHIIVFDVHDPIDLLVDQLRLSADHTATFYITDIELPLLKRIETISKQPIEEFPLPEKFTIVNPAKKEKAEIDPTQGGAFHEKKAKNTKEYNYNTKDRRLMKGKVSKRKNH